MAELFRSTAVPAGPAEGVVVVHCSDPRYQPHFQEFLRRGLGLSRYGLVAIPGGVQALTLVHYLPKFAWSGWRWLKFMMSLAETSRVILLTHEDCRWYIENRFADPAQARARQIEDLRQVRDAIQGRFGALQVDLYYAALDAGGASSFEAV